MRTAIPIPLLASVAALLLTAVASAEVFSPRPDFTRRSRYAVEADNRYRSPVQLYLTRNGLRLYVACEEQNAVLVVDTGRRRVVDRIDVGRMPFGLALSPDENTLYVSNRWDASVSVVDTESLEVTATIPVGADPHGIAVTENRIYVANMGTNDVSVIDPADRSERKRLYAGRSPFAVAEDPAGRRLYVSNQYSNPVPFRHAPALELTVIDADGPYVSERRTLPASAIGQGAAVSPDARFVAIAVEFPKNLIPQSQVYQGWMVTYGLVLAETRPDGRSARILIDEANRYYADPYGIAFSPDGRRLYVSSSGADALTVVDVEKLYGLLKVDEDRIGLSDPEIERYARHLGLSSEHVVARISTGANPKAIAVSGDGRWVYVAERLEDTVGIIDTRKLERVGAIDLGGPDTVTELRQGARLFNYASISFQRQMSCNTCHPEYHVDGLVYDIAVDGGMGRNLVDNMSMRGLAETAPFKWSGKNPNLARQEGPRAAQLFFRTHGFRGDENQAIVRFIESIPVPPNPNRQVGERLNEFQALGKRMFEREYDNLGRYIPKGNRCITCHPPPLGTDRRLHDVGSRNDHDRDGVFDTPHLINVYDRPPYMHDGRCYSLEEIWTEHNPEDLHGRTNDMRKDQLNALIEYIKTF